MYAGVPKYPLSEKRSDYYYFGQYKTPVLYYLLLQNWGDSQSSPSSLPQVKGQLLVLDGHLYCLTEDWQKIAAATTEALENKNLQFFTDFLNIARTITGDLKQELDAGPSVKNLEQFFNLVHRLNYPWHYILPMAQAVEDWLKDKVSVDDLPHFFTPSRPVKFTEYQQALAATKPGDMKRIENLYKQFEWVGLMHFWGEKNSIEKVTQGIAQAHSIETPPKPNNIPDDLKWVYEITREMGFYRQSFAEYCAIATLHLHQYLADKNISLDLALWLTPDELLQLVQESPTHSLNDVEERKKGYGLFNTLVTGQELNRLMDILVDKVEAQTEIKGTPASKGQARGVVKIIMVPTDMSKMNPGDILVAHETTPDLVPAMQKAAAIVTDVGGLTSHAAIVSREMGKPCVIGTKVATKVLKDGDLVEVDADKGIVRKV